jgi:hypothetical protein
MRRRSLLAATGVGLAGCARLTSPPAVRFDSGHARLHPASERVFTTGLDDESRPSATAVPDEAPELLGPDASQVTVDTLTTPEREEQFHVVTQLRSTPDQPRELSPAVGSTFEWVDRSTLRFHTEIDPWGDLDDLKNAEKYRTAERLVYTGVWTIAGTAAPPADVTVERIE